MAAALQSAFPNDRFLGEEDATDLRADANLLATAKGMAARLSKNPNLTDADFVFSVDRGVELAAPDGGGKGGGEEGERVWILDPIDGTKGLITGQQYIIGLALIVGSEARVAAMGNPAVDPAVMVAVKGQGLRYYSAAVDGPASFLDLPREDRNKWHGQSYDVTKLAPMSGLPHLLSPGNPSTSLMAMRVPGK